MSTTPRFLVIAILSSALLGASPAGAETSRTSLHPRDTGSFEAKLGALRHEYETLPLQYPYTEFGRKGRTFAFNEVYVDGEQLAGTMRKLRTLLGAARSEPARYLDLVEQVFFHSRWDHDPHGKELDALRAIATDFIATGNTLTAGNDEPLRSRFVSLRTRLRPALDILEERNDGGESYARHSARQMRAFASIVKSGPPRDVAWAARHRITSQGPLARLWGQLKQSGVGLGLRVRR